MSYALNRNKLDQVSLTGTFLSSGRDWAHVLHGRLSGAAGADTSANLLAVMSAEFVAGATPVLAQLSSDVEIDSIACRQIASWRSRFGRVAQVSMTIGGGGTITLPVVLDGGEGYSPAGALLEVYDPDGTGVGAILDAVVVGDRIDSVNVVSAGTSYGASSVIRVSLPDLPSPSNRPEITYGPSDFLAVTPAVGGIATDRAPSFNAFSLKGRSSIPGTAGRSSAHFPGVPEISTTNNNLTGGARTAMQTAATSWFLTPYTMGGGRTYTICSFSPTTWFRYYPLYGALSASVPFSAALSTMVVNVGVGSLLGRKVSP